MRDINTTFQTGFSQPHGFIAGPNRVYFVATTPETGTELFSIDGSANNGGLRLEADLVPGTGSSNPLSDQIWAGTRTVYFVTEIGTDTTQLFALDSVTRATTQLAEFSNLAGTSAGVVAGDRLFFMPVVFPSELWTTDGTPNGTQSLQAALGSTRTVVNGSMVADGGMLYFIANGPSNAELWSSDGSLAGTQEIAALDGQSGVYQVCPINFDGAYWMIVQQSVWRHAFGSATMEHLADVPSGDLLECRLTGMGSSVYYILTPPGFPSNPEQLWRSGASVGDTSVVQTIDGDGDATTASTLATIGDHLVFWTRVLWRSDGTTAGTGIVSTAEGSIQPSIPTCCFRSVSGGLIFWGTTEGQTTLDPLWITDGTDQGTHRIDSPYGVYTHDAAMFGGRIYGEFAPDSSPHSRPEVWSTDGTPTGIVPVATIWPATQGALPGLDYDGETSADGTTLLFLVPDWTIPLNPPSRIWKSDGSEAGTFGLGANAFAGYVSSFAPGSDHRTIFMSESPSGIYVADAALQNAVPVAGGNPSNFHGYTASGGQNAIFTCDYVTLNPPGLCGLDPTLSTRIQLTPSAGTEEIRMVGSVGGVGLFFSNAAFENWTLWRTDGTPAGTFEIGALTPLAENTQDSMPSISHGGRIYFEGCDENLDCSLYVSDGTAAGTQALGDIGASAMITSFAFAHDRLLFVTALPDISYRLWSYADGVGVGLLLDSLSLGVSTRLSDLAAGGDVVRFASSQCDSGGHCTGALWNSDGTATGTQELIDPIAWQPTGSAFAAYDDQHSVFTCESADVGDELCETDGTAAGTRLIRDIFPGPSGSRISLRSANGKIYFAADDGHHGLELWTLDGDQVFANGFDVP